MSSNNKPNSSSLASSSDEAIGVLAMVDSQEVNAESSAAEAAVKAAAQSNESQVKESSLELIFIDDWRQAWRFFSLWFITIAGILQSTWDLVPTDIRASLPAGTLKDVTIVLLILGALGRFVKQVNKGDGVSN